MATAAALRERGVQQVVASPFQRCLQTAAVIASALGLLKAAVEVDWTLCEARCLLLHLCSHNPGHRVTLWLLHNMQVLNERFLSSSGRPALQGSAAEWIWGGAGVATAWRAATSALPYADSRSAAAAAPSPGLALATAVHAAEQVAGLKAAGSCAAVGNSSVPVPGVQNDLGAASSGSQQAAARSSTSAQSDCSGTAELVNARGPDSDSPSIRSAQHSVGGGNPRAAATHAALAAPGASAFHAASSPAAEGAQYADAASPADPRRAGDGFHRAGSGVSGGVEPRHAASALPTGRGTLGGGDGVCGGVGVRVAATAPPCSPEALEAAHARYAAALEAIAERHSACRCVLVVTHGARGMPEQARHAEVCMGACVDLRGWPAVLTARGICAARNGVRGAASAGV